MYGGNDTVPISLWRGRAVRRPTECPLVISVKPGDTLILSVYRRNGTAVLSRALSAELVVASLQQQLREKDLKLTDIRLEALTSAHQLDHLRDAMNRMQVRPAV